MHKISASQFAANDFNSEKYVKDLSSQCIGADELRQHRAKIQDLANNTSASLKRNVYQNYIQFIETSKEISHLESEMYQLSQLLSEQRSLLSSLETNQNARVAYENEENTDQENDSQSKAEESKKKLMQLLENVEGAFNLIETPNRVCLVDGNLLELDALEGTPVKKVHAYLFNDILMIASLLPYTNRRTLFKYRVQVVYDLQNLAIVNIRDHGRVKLAFKVLAFPDTWIFQCGSVSQKKEWLERFELAKKTKVSRNSRADSTTEETIKPQPIVSYESVSIDEESESQTEEVLPEWMLEVTEDLDSCIAQRHFEEAYNILQKAKSYIETSCQTKSQSDELKMKLRDKADFLVSTLTRELESALEVKSLQGGGLRSAKKAVKILIQLNRSTQACQLYLRLCSATIKGRLKRVKKEGAISSYVKTYSALAFNNIIEMIREYNTIFPPSAKCVSAQILWCSQELKLIFSHLAKQMFIPQVPLSTLVECIIILRDNCEQLSQVRGLDFRYQLDEQYKNPLNKAIQDTREKCIDVIKVRCSEDNLKPTNFYSVQNLKKILGEFDDMGIPIPEFYVTKGTAVTLTHNTLNFSKLYIGVLEDCLNIITSDMVNFIEELLMTMLEMFVQHLRGCFNNPKFVHEKKIIQDNMKFICDVIMGRTLELHQSVTGHTFLKLLALRKYLQDEFNSASKPKAAPRTLSKYSSGEYL